MAYARHQSFYIRDKWFSKGLRAVAENGRFFYEEFSFEKIGLGKNMLESLKYWLLAFQVIEDTTIEGQKHHKLTDLGQLLLDRDRVLQKNDTISILHYNLVRNQNDQSTVFEWFFTKYKETVFTKDELLNSFVTWVNKRETKEISERSLKRDIDCILQFYTKTPDENDPEDSIFSPFSRIGLITYKKSGQEHDIIMKESPDLKNVGLCALYFILLQYCNEHDIDLISVEEIMNSEFLWGKLFNLSRNKIIEALNVLASLDENPISYVRTNNLDYIKIPVITPEEYLNSVYLKG